MIVTSQYVTEIRAERLTNRGSISVTYFYLLWKVHRKMCPFSSR